MSTKGHFGDEVHWMKFHDGLQKILNDHKPGMVLIEKSWCPTCKKVGDRFIKDQEFHRLSKPFVMIQCIDDEEPNFDEFRPGRCGCDLTDSRWFLLPPHSVHRFRWKY